MGLILDSSILIEAERAKSSVRELLINIFEKFGSQDIALSAMSVMELAHGYSRASSQERMIARRNFLDEFLAAVPAYPMTASVARRAGEIDGKNRKAGTSIPTSDLIIGVTALELGFAVATHNIRDFQLIPGLTVNKYG